MITKLYNKFDKKSIPDLPRVTFQGKIVVVLNEEEANKAVDYLLSADILGIDSEKVVFVMFFGIYFARILSFIG